MTFSTSLNGSTIAYESPEVSCLPAETKVPQTLADLKLRLAADPSKIHRTFAPTVRLLALYRGRPAPRIEIAELLLESVIGGFRPYLRENTNYTQNSINTHVARYTTLRRHAEEYGFHRDVPEAWLEVRALASVKGCLEFADHFAAITQTPNDVTVLAVKEFARGQIRDRVRNLEPATNRQNKFLKLLRDCNFTEQQPIATARDEDFGIPLENMPPYLKAQVEGLRSNILLGASNSKVSQDWQQQPWDTPTEEERIREEGTGTRRTSTANNIVHAVSELAGYVKDVCKQLDGWQSLEELVREDPIRSFRNYSLRVRLKTGDSVRNPLAGLFAALRRTPEYKHIDLEWTDKFLDEIPRTSQAERDKRKEEKYLSIEELSAIPDQIKFDRKKEEARLREAIANEQRLDGRRSKYRVRKAALSIRTQKMEIFRLMMAEFIFRFLIVWPWRGSNLCNCMIAGDSPNLVKKPVRRTASLQLSQEAKTILAGDQDAEFWQIFLSSREHKSGRKTGRDIHALLPSEIVAPMEEYFSYRSKLFNGDDPGSPFNGNDPGSLLINERGRPFRLASLEKLVQHYAVLFANAPMNPHMFRDAVTDECMINHPQDSEHVAKGLFHSSDKTMKRSYSGRHNASAGANVLNDIARARREKKEKERSKSGLKAMAQR